MKKFVLGFACALVFVWLKKRYSVKVTEVHDDEKRNEDPVPEEKDFQEVPGTGVQDGEPEKGSEDLEPSTGNFVGYRNRVRV